MEKNCGAKLAEGDKSPSDSAASQAKSSCSNFGVARYDRFERTAFLGGCWGVLGDSLS